MAGNGQFQDPVAASPPEGIGPRYPLNMRFRRSHSHAQYGIEKQKLSPLPLSCGQTGRFVLVMSIVRGLEL